MISTNTNLNETESGLGNLQRHQQRGGGALAVGLLSFTLAAGIIIGCLITTAIYLAAHL